MKGETYNENETIIKVVSSYPSGHLEVRCPKDKKKNKKKKNISVIKNISFMLIRKRFINK